jgi:hypothetical protein
MAASDRNIYLDLSDLSGDSTPVSLAEFIAVNSAPGVTPLERGDIAVLRRLKVGEHATLGIGGGRIDVWRTDGPGRAGSQKETVMREFEDRVQLKDLVRSRGVRSKAIEGAVEIPENMRDMDPWTVTLTYEGRKLTVPFFMGIGHHGASPQAYEVLGALLSDVSTFENATSFEEWASDYGYDPYSRSAERIYNAIAKLVPKVHKLLGEDFDEFAAAEY